MVTRWECEECGATGKVSYGATDNAFEVAGKVIADHNKKTVIGCHRRPDSAVRMELDLTVIVKEPTRG